MRRMLVLGGDCPPLFLSPTPNHFSDSRRISFSVLVSVVTFFPKSVVSADTFLRRSSLSKYSVTFATTLTPYNEEVAFSDAAPPTPHASFKGHSREFSFQHELYPPTPAWASPALRSLPSILHFSSLFFSRAANPDERRKAPPGALPFSFFPGVESVSPFSSRDVRW